MVFVSIWRIIFIHNLDYTEVLVENEEIFYFVNISNGMLSAIHY